MNEENRKTYQELCVQLRAPEEIRETVLAIAQTRDIPLQLETEDRKLEAVEQNMAKRAFPAGNVWNHRRQHRIPVKKVLLVAVIAILVIAATVGAYAISQGVFEDMRKREENVIGIVPPEGLDAPLGVIVDEITGEEREATIDHYWYNLLLELGKVYQYEIYQDDNGYHAHRYVKAFSPEELEGAVISSDCNWMEIQGKLYRLQMGWTGQFGEEDEPIVRIETDNPRVYEPSSGVEEEVQIRILRVYAYENWENYPQIMAQELVEGIIEKVILPIRDGQAAFFNSKDEQIRELSKTERADAQVSLSGTMVDIAGVLYIPIYQPDSQEEVQQLRLYAFDDMSEKGSDLYQILMRKWIDQGNYRDTTLVNNQTPISQDMEVEDAFYSIDEWMAWEEKRND